MTSNVPGATDIVAVDAEDIIRDITAVDFPPGILDDLGADSHKLSAADIAYRVRSLRRRHSTERIREGIREVLTELEIYRTGFDEGHDAGYERALADVLNAVREVKS